MSSPTDSFTTPAIDYDGHTAYITLLNVDEVRLEEVLRLAIRSYNELHPEEPVNANFSINMVKPTSGVPFAYVYFNSAVTFSLVCNHNYDGTHRVETQSSTSSHTPSVESWGTKPSDSHTPSVESWGTKPSDAQSWGDEEVVPSPTLMPLDLTEDERINIKPSRIFMPEEKFSTLVLRSDSVPAWFTEVELAQLIFKYVQDQEVGEGYPMFCVANVPSSRPSRRAYVVFDSEVRCLFVKQMIQRHVILHPSTLQPSVIYFTLGYETENLRKFHFITADEARTSIGAYTPVVACAAKPKSKPRRKPKKKPATAQTLATTNRFNSLTVE